MAVVYFLLSPATNLVKIGFSSSFKDRLKQLQAASSDVLQKLHCIENATLEDEECIHYKFRGFRVRGEWFAYIGELKKYVEDLRDGEVLYVREEVPTETPPTPPAKKPIKRIGFEKPPYVRKPGRRGKGKPKLYRGYRISGNRFQASIFYRNRILHLGSFRREIEAAYAYDCAAQMLGKDKINHILTEDLPPEVRTTIDFDVRWVLERHFEKRKWGPLKLNGLPLA